MSKSRSKSKRHTAVGPAPAQPPHLQVGALCWRRSGKGLRVLLITSRDTGRWVIPKGWPMRRRTDAEAAAREAYEEAGLRGAVSDRSVGLYGYRKALGAGRHVQCTVRVFPLEVSEMLRKYPETGQRRIKWFSPAKAAVRVDEPELKEILRGFDPDEAPADAGRGDVPRGEPAGGPAADGEAADGGPAEGEAGDDAPEGAGGWAAEDGGR